MLNFYYINKIHKIINDREANNESKDYLLDFLNKNKIVFDRFLEENKLTYNFYSLLYCHSRFSIIGNKYKYWKEFWPYYLYYYYLKLKNLLPVACRKRIKIILNKLREK
jgi:hypothetical protein